MTKVLHMAYIQYCVHITSHLILHEIKRSDRICKVKKPYLKQIVAFIFIYIFQNLFYQ
jgi:hypothetical protein